jgi:hypothetical protein
MVSTTSMTNFPVDPTPYAPGHYQIIQVKNLPQQCRYHVSDGIRAKHEDFTIATVTPAVMISLLGWFEISFASSLRSSLDLL